jgi:hypothetical protein
MKIVNTQCSIVIVAVVVRRSAFTLAGLSPFSSDPTTSISLLSQWRLLCSHHQQSPIIIMATEGPTECSTEEEHSFCNHIRYWIGSPIQVHMLRSVQIAITFAADCELQHGFASREKKKFRGLAEAYFRILAG